MILKTVGGRRSVSHPTFLTNEAENTYEERIPQPNTLLHIPPKVAQKRFHVHVGIFHQNGEDAV